VLPSLSAKGRDVPELATYNDRLGNDLQHGVGVLPESEVTTFGIGCPDSNRWETVRMS
jgi:hypothetical protein